jgi:Tripartite tricarboxylate transporter TctB family
MHSVNRKDLFGGGVMLLLGIGTVAQSLQYRIGSLRQMGPGYFPLALGVILAAIGLLIMAASLRTASIVPAMKLPAEWRGWFCICAGIVAFAVLGRYGGLLPATFACVFIAALGDRKNSLLAALVLSAAMTVVCLIVFWWLLKVQLPLVRWA